MRILGNLTFAGLGQIQNLRTENLAADPATPSVGQVWYNTTQGTYKGFDGTTIIAFATGGSTDTVLAEVDAIEAAVGLNSNGTYAPTTTSNYINGATTLKQASVLLDVQVKTNADATVANANAIAANLAEIDKIEAGSGLNADGTFTAPVATNYISAATSLKAADVLLDTQVKANADATVANATAITTKVSKAGDTMTGDLAFGGVQKVIGLAAPVAAGDAANKAYVDSLVNGLFWLPPVDARLAVAPATAAQGYRFLSSADQKIYTATAANTFNAGVAGVSGQAVMVKSDESGWTTDGVTWVQFTGAGQITAGVGLVKAGNVIDINMGAGIGQLPTDEVGIDVLAAGALFLTVDGTTASTLTNAQLSLKLDGASMARSIAGLRVAAAGVTEVELSASVAGGGLVGGAGVAIAVGAGAGIVVTADAVAFDTVFGDARYINTAGDTLTGDLVLAADPTTALMAATKQYVDALRTTLQGSTYVHDGAVAATSHTVTHSIGAQFCNVTVIDSANKQILPDSVTFDTANQLTVTFSSAITCKVVVTGKHA